MTLDQTNKDHLQIEPHERFRSQNPRPGAPAPLTNPPLRPGNAEITAEQAAQIKPESAELETTE